MNDAPTKTAFLLAWNGRDRGEPLETVFGEFCAALSPKSSMGTEPSDEQWYDIASSHASRNWNDDEYLDLIKSVGRAVLALAAHPQAEPVAWLAENQDGSFDAYKEVHALIDECRQGFPVYRATHPAPQAEPSRATVPSEPTDAMIAAFNAVYNGLDLSDVQAIIRAVLALAAPAVPTLLTIEQQRELAHMLITSQPPTREETETEDVSDVDPAPLLAKMAALRAAQSTSPFTDKPNPYSIGEGPSDRAAQSAAPAVQSEPKPEFYCNKCGYLGPDQYPHNRRNGSQCGYMASKVPNGQTRNEHQGAAQSCRTDASAIGRPDRDGADQHHEHGERQPEDFRGDTGSDSAGAGVSAACAIRADGKGDATPEHHHSVVDSDPAAQSADAVDAKRAEKYLRVIRQVRAIADEWPEVEIDGSPMSRIRSIVAFAGSQSAAHPEGGDA